MNLRFF